MTKAKFMFRKIVTAIIVVPLAAVMIAFAVANRETVTVSFDPFSAASPAYAATLPLFAVILLVLIVGVVVGGVAAWLRQGKWRRAARQFEGESRTLRAELDSLRRRFAVNEPAAPIEPETSFFDPTARPVLPPPTP
jgi:uncharacterized integral membrane protein